MANYKQCSQCRFYQSKTDLCSLLHCAPKYDGINCMLASYGNNAGANTYTASQSKQGSSQTKRTPKKPFKNTLWIYVVLLAVVSLLATYVGGREITAVIAYFLIALLLLVVIKPQKRNTVFQTVCLTILSLASLSLAILAMSRHSDEDQFDFKRAITFDSLNSYKKYISLHYHGNHYAECCDSVSAREFDLVKNNYSVNKHENFINSCASPQIKERALVYLDEKYEYVVKNMSPSAVMDFKQFYVETYPQGQHYLEAKGDVYEIMEKNAFDFAVDTGTLGAYENFLTDYPNGPHAEAMWDLIAMYKAEHKYDNNFLSTGSQPYANYYGRNWTGSGCAVIVNATGDSDVVVIVKKNNSEGKIAGHAYIHKGDSYKVNLRPGVYQVFFYYGSGWNPNKKLDNGLTGGFMLDEQYGKDEPLSLTATENGNYISYDQMEYTLQKVEGGNFSMKGSDAGEVF